MKTKADTLDKILDDYALDECRKIYPSPDKKKFREKIIALFKECVPASNRKSCEESNHYFSRFKAGFNLCRTETLKNIEEMGK